MSLDSIKDQVVALFEKYDMATLDFDGLPGRPGDNFYWLRSARIEGQELKLELWPKASLTLESPSEASFSEPKKIPSLGVRIMGFSRGRWTQGEGDGFVKEISGGGSIDFLVSPLD